MDSSLNYVLVEYDTEIVIYQVDRKPLYVLSPRDKMHAEELLANLNAPRAELAEAA